MDKSILTLWVLILFMGKSLSQPMRLESDRTVPIPRDTKSCFIDPQGIIYFVNNDEIRKESSFGSLVQSIKKWQTVDDIETINSLKVMVFSKSQQQLCLLDNTLSANGDCINLDELGLLNVSAVASSKRPDMIWLYDELNSKLILFNYVTKTEVQGVSNLQGILGISGDITLNENESGLWISSTDGKICLMDDFMNVVRCASESNQAMIPFANGFFFVNEHTLYYRDLFEGVNEVYKISTTETILEMYVSSNQLITRTPKELKVFIIQP
jgi:hypothetical protein